MGAFRTQVGEDLCGLEQLAELLQGQPGSRVWGVWDVGWLGVGRGGGGGGGDDMPEAEVGGEGPPVQILGTRNVTEGMFER